MRIQELARHITDEVETRTGVRLTVALYPENAEPTAAFWNGRRVCWLSIRWEQADLRGYREQDKSLSCDGGYCRLDDAIDMVSALSWPGWPERETRATVPLDDLYLLIAAAPESVRKRLSERYEWAMAPESFSSMPEPLED